MILAAVTVLAMWDFAADDGGLTSGNGAQWQWGLAEKGPATIGWATRLDRPYLNDTVDTLEVSLPSLSSAVRPRLVLRHTYAFAAGDAGHLEVEDGNGWRAVAPAYASEVTFRGDSGGWTESAWWLDDLGDGARARLVFVSDTTGADEGWFVAEARVVDGDAVPPRITPIAVPVDTQDVNLGARVEVAAEDDVALVGVELAYSLDGGPLATLPMADRGDGTFVADLPAVALGTSVGWHVRARDTENVARWPSESDASFRVFLAAPEALTGPSGRVIGDEVTLSWSAPPSPWPVAAYEVFAVGEDTPLAATGGLAAAVPVAGPGPYGFEVAAVYDLGGGDLVSGDRSPPVWIDAEVPRLIRVDPGVLRAGETRRIRVLGDALYLSAADAALDLGPDVEVLDVTMVDVSRLDAVVWVAPDATTGPRALDLTGAWGTSTHESALRIEGSASSALAVVPSALVQGWSGTIEVTAPDDFAGPLRRADDDAGLVASAVGSRGSRDATLSVAVSRRAAVGAHRLWFDDGARWWSVDVDVAEANEVGRTCAPGGSPWTIAWLCVFLARRRR